jgi:hypothetical protein
MKEYDYPVCFFNGLATVWLNGKCGFIDRNYNEICEIKYDEVWHFENEFAYVRIGEIRGFINKQGIEVVACNYSYEIAKKLLKKYKLNQKRIEKLKTII